MSNSKMHHNHPEALLRHMLLYPTPRVSDSASLDWDPRICVSDDVDPVVSGTTIYIKWAIPIIGNNNKSRSK